MASLTRRNDLLETLGLKSRPTLDIGGSILPAVALFGAGVVMGAGVALMLAPKPGRELREDVYRTANQMGSTLKSSIPGPTHEEEVGTASDFHTSTSQPPRI